ncbi:hypothetical protein JZU71_02850, partial [bacterium]|nr:hypothetical protein [bacterium]
MTKPDRQRIVLVIDHEASTFKALSRIGENSGFNTLSFSDSSEFIAWLQNNTTEASRRDKTFCVVFDSQFVGLFRQHLPTWFHGTPRICISRSNKIALTLNSIRLGLFDFMAKPFNLEGMRTTLERAFTDADLQSNKPTSLESIIERIEQLTRRELEICEKLSKGLSGKQIASELAISIKTYYVHRTNLLQKTGA